MTGRHSHVRAGHGDEPGDERGVVGFEALPLLVLVFVIGILVFSEAWAALDAKIATSSGAREATRTFVEAPAGSSVGEAFLVATAAAERAVSAHGRAGATEIVAEGPLSLDRCTRVTFVVSTETRFLAIPFVRSSGFSRTVRSRHTEIVDPFRDGLEGALDCVE